MSVGETGAPDDVADPDGADAGDPGVAPADGATFAACLEPKMADTMLPNTLMMPSCPYCLWLHSARGRARCTAAANFAGAFNRRHILKPDGATMQSARFLTSPPPRAGRAAPQCLNQINSKCNLLLLIDHHAENGSGNVTQIQPCFTDL